MQRLAGILNKDTEDAEVAHAGLAFGFGDVPASRSAIKDLVTALNRAPRPPPLELATEMATLLPSTGSTAALVSLVLQRQVATWTLTIKEAAASDSKREGASDMAAGIAGATLQSRRAWTCSRRGYRCIRARESGGGGEGSSRCQVRYPLRVLQRGSSCQPSLSVVERRRRTLH